MRILSGHQPVYLPWLGLFHKLSLCDVFVFMDTVQYLDGDWNNRNKIRTAEGWSWLTLPVDRAKSNKANLSEVYLKSDEHPDPQKCWPSTHWKSLERHYKKSPYFSDYAEPLKEIYLGKAWNRLIDLAWEQFLFFSKCLDLADKELVRMSEVEFDGRKQMLILDQCKRLNADGVVLGEHGRNYIETDLFLNEGVPVYFQSYEHPQYSQRYGEFVSHLSVVDLLFNHGDESKDILMSGNSTYEDVVREMSAVNNVGT